MPTTSNFGWTTPADTDLVKDGAAAIRTLGNGIDTSFLDLKGGTTGQVLSKNSNTDLDFTWVAQDDSNAIQNAIVDAKGDIISATAADTPSRLAVGTNGQVLTADSTTATGLKWATPAGGGKVLQVVYGTYNTVTTVTTSGYQDTGLSLAITPSSTASKVLIIVNQAIYFSRSSTVQAVGIKLLRGSTGILSTTIQDTSVGMAATGASFVDQRTWCPVVYLDSPSTTSSTTYKIQGSLYQTSGSGTAVYQEGSNVSQITLLEIGA